MSSGFGIGSLGSGDSCFKTQYPEHIYLASNVRGFCSPLTVL